MLKRILNGHSQFFVASGLISLMIVLSGCASSTYRSTDSANQNSRVSVVVIHHTTANFSDSLRILTEPSSRPVSSHYLIPEPEDATYGKSGVDVYQLVPETRRAWHAGTSYWAGKSGLNDQSIGIELVNQTYCLGSDSNANTGNSDRLCFYPDFAESQLVALIKVLEGILERHPDIEPTHIIGHADIAPDRKIDPGPRFPWQRFAQLGYGAWYDDEAVIRYWERFRVEPLPIENIQRALHAYGYGIEVTGELDRQTGNVIRAFQMHFRPETVNRKPDAKTTAVLYALIEKYYPDELAALLLFEKKPGTSNPSDSNPILHLDEGSEPPDPNPVLDLDQGSEP